MGRKYAKEREGKKNPSLVNLLARVHLDRLRRLMTLSNIVTLLPQIEVEIADGKVS